MIIEPGLADRRDAPTFRQLTQRGDDIIPRLFRVIGMNADDRENIRILFRELDRAPAAFKRGADRYDARDAGFGSACEDVLKISCEIRVVEVSVGIDAGKIRFAALRF